TTYTVFYEFTDQDSCYNIDSMKVRVEVPQVVQAPPPDTVCENDAPFTLTGFSPAGGTLTGNGVTGGLTYDPGLAGVGLDTLIYCDGTPGTTCFVCDTTTILVQAPPPLTAIPDTMCANGGPLSLNNNALAYGNPVMGIWSGPGVFQDGMGNYWFDTTVAGVYTVCFTYTDNDSTLGCTAQACMDILVNSIPIITFANDSVAFCQTPVLQQLSAFPTGGIWSGPGVNSSGVFDPADPAIIPNQVYTIYYSISNADSCNNIDSMVVRVDTPAVVVAPLPDTVCQNDPIFAFSGYSPPGGTFSGPGVNGTNFDPDVAGPGLKTIIYCYGDSATSCQVCDTTTILVESPPPLTALPDSMCGNNGPISLMDNALAYGMVVQGMWTGPGVFQDSAGNYWFDTTVAGIYTVCFTYTDNDSTQGCTDQACMDIEVYPVPVADFPSPADACVGDSILFVNNSTGASSYLWSFGDPLNSTSTAANPVFAYNTIGTFVITLDAFSGQGCQDSRTDSIFISEPPVADFSVTADTCASRDILPGVDGVVAMVQNNSYTAGGTYAWDFGGGFDSLGNTTSTDSIIPLLYFPQNNNATITYYITLTLANYCDTVTHTDSVIVHPLPIADFYPNVDTFCSPFVPVWINISSGDPTNYYWYGDTTFTNLISTDSVPNPMALTYTGTADTTYYFSLIAENGCGRDTGYHQVVVLPNTVTAFFNVSNTQGCAPLTLNFIGLANAPNTSVDFGDNSGVFNQDTISHTYTNPGTYLIQYFADNTCSYDTGTIVITVFPSPQIHIQPSDTIVCPDQAITFFDSLGSTGKTGYVWNFGDNTGTSSQNSPTHVYTNPGLYTVSVSVQSTVNGCVSTDSTTVEVRPRPVADFLASSYQVCVGESIHFTNLSSGGNNYFWSFGDTNTSTVFAPTHVYLQPNTYFVTLTVFDSLGCADVDSATVLVNPNPVASFSFVQSDSCGVPVNVQFTNLSTGNPIGYMWNFDPDTSSLNSPLHTFNLPGTYEITLVAATAFGCTDTATDSVIIYPQPAPAWDIIPSQGCGPLEVTFVNLSPDSSFTQAYIRFFNGGALNPIVDSAIYTYQASSGNTSYFPELYLDYDGKCFDSISEQIDVFSLPDANFRVLNDSSCGVPTVVQFEDLSSDFNAIASWNWNFGDPASGNQNTSNNQSPSHRYETPGIYPVRLIVENPSGCRDTLVRNVTIFPQPQAAIQPDTAIGCYELLVNFTTPDTISANAWQWDFGDGGAAFGNPVSHRYLTEGDYTVRLVSNYNQVCYDTAYTTIRVGIPPEAEFSAVLEDQCDLEALLLTTNTSRHADRYLWL
ncbi:MAG: PKD domain-containing protein, partial [Bacteroidetes bacterium]|nr:PKD domain-containing protein [Bacteroidota bacterium]